MQEAYRQEGFNPRQTAGIWPPAAVNNAMEVFREAIPLYHAAG